MGYGLLNLGSLLLGLLAWALPIAGLAKRNKARHKKWIVLVFISISACAVSLFLQILYRHHLQNIGDWPAIMDTSRGTVFMSLVLLFVTLMLNMLAMIAYNKTNRL